MADLTDRGGAIASHIPAMPIHVAAQPAGWIFLIGTLLILSSILAWWAIGGERRERGWALPFVFVGTALSAVVIEPIFDNTLLYWYPPVNELAFFRGFERTIPWYVPLGYAWFFGGTAYLLARRFLWRARLGARGMDLPEYLVLVLRLRHGGRPALWHEPGLRFWRYKQRHREHVVFRRPGP